MGERDGCKKKMVGKEIDFVLWGLVREEVKQKVPLVFLY